MFHRPYDTSRWPLPEQKIQAALHDEGVAFAQEEDEVYSPPVTLWAFLSQVLFQDEQRSCVAAVARVVLLMAALAREVVLLSLATGMLSAMALGRYMGKETGETALLRELFDQLRAGDVLLADRYYCSYFMIALLMQLGLDVLARLLQAAQMSGLSPRELSFTAALQKFAAGRLADRG